VDAEAPRTCNEPNRPGPSQSARVEAEKHLRTPISTMLEDIAIVTGGTAISEDLGVKLEHATLSMLGGAKTALINKENTTIVRGAGKKADIEARITQLKAQIEETTSDYDREKLQNGWRSLPAGSR
jgi:chaperonin GroEL